MPKVPLPPGVHLLLGGSPGGIFNRNFGRKQLLIEEDLLNCGPTPKCADWKVWSKMRSEFWRDVSPPEFPHLHEVMRNLSDHSERLMSEPCIFIWAATSLPEQLYISFVVALTTKLGIPADHLRLFQFERTKTHDSLIGSMGELNEENMAAFPEPQPLTKEAITDYLAAWCAITSPAPGPIEKFPEAHVKANRWLRDGMRLMSRRFPEKASGLPYWDRLLLEKVEERGPTVARAIGYTISDHYDDLDRLGDWYLLHRLVRMADAKLPRPLVKIGGEEPFSFRSNVELTPFGRDVVEGKLSACSVNPIEDWAAGVKLSSAGGAVWFNDGGRIVRG